MLWLQTCSWLDECYDADSWQVDILTVETGWTICNLGGNVQEILTYAPAAPADADILIVMLGTNELFYGYTPEKFARKLVYFLQTAAAAPYRTNSVNCVIPWFMTMDPVNKLLEISETSLNDVGSVTRS